MALALPIVLLLAGCGDQEAGPPTAHFIEELRDGGPLEDMWLGDENATVTIIEYASMTCPHCRAFHMDVFDDFVAEFVDTGKVHFVLREFPLDERAAAAIMLARCAPGDNGYYAMVAHLFETQPEWAFGDDAEAFPDVLYAQVEQAGFTRDDFEACLTNQQLFLDVVATYNRGVDLGVDATPTFFINGRKMQGELTIEELRSAIEAAQL